MQTVDINIDELRPYEKNAKIHSPKQIKQIAASLLEFGWRQPLVVTADKVVVVGHGRLAGAKIARKTDPAFSHAPCLIADDLTDEQIKAYRLADNKLNESPWDPQLTEEELAGFTQIDMSAFGFDLSELAKEETGEVVEDDYDEELPKKPKSKLGDIYQLGRHRLMCGDSTNPENVKKLTGGELADLLITDPPYNISYQGKTKDKLTIQSDNQKDEDFRNFLRSAFSTADEVMKPGAAFYIWYADIEGYNFHGACRDIGWQVREVLIWNKSTLVLGRKDYQWKHEPCLYGWKDGASHLWTSDRKQTTVIDFERPTKADQHPTMKPVGLFDYQIKNNTKRGDSVLDIFGGSGTTILACEQNGRSAFCMELDPRYVDVIIGRWEQFTGQKAVKLN